VNGVTEIAARLAGIAKTRLVVRVLRHEVMDEFPHIGFRRWVDIFILGAGAPEEMGGRGFFEVHYFSNLDPDQWWRPFEFRFVHWEPMLDPERLDIRLEDWWKCIPLWATGKEVVVCAKDYRHSFHELPLAEFHLLPHYARLLGLLVDQKKSEDKVVAFAADLFARRFGAFLQERIRDLERVLGDISILGDWS